MAVIGAIAPDHDDEQRKLVSRSILGQVLHYQMARPFIDRMSPGDTNDPARVRSCADHIIQFTLRALGLSDEDITSIVAAPQSNPQEHSEESPNTDLES